MFAGPHRANNHLLNSVLARTTMFAFGTSEWALRLPNVLAFVLFLVASLALMRRVSNGFVGTCGFVLLTAHPYLLELFSMERGYGLGLGFTAASLVFMLRAQERSDPARQETLAIAFAAAAVVSNFTFLLVFGAAVLLTIVRRPPRSLADTAPWAIPSVLLAAIVTVPLTTLKRSGQLYFGGTSGFFRDTVSSLIQLTLAEGGASRLTERILEIAVVVGLAGGLGVLLLAPAVSSGRRLVSLALPIAILAGLASTVQHALLGTPYLVGRTGIFLLPLFALTTIGIIDVLAASSRRIARIAGVGFAFALACGALFNLAVTENLDHSVVARYDADTKRMLVDLPTLRHGSERVHLCAEGVLEPSLNFYRVTEGLAWLDPVARDEHPGNCNFLFIQPGGLNLGTGTDLLLVKRYPLTGNLLVRRVHDEDPIRSPREDATLTGSIDEPTERERVNGNLSVRGWARIPGEDLKITLFINGVARPPSSFRRVPRPDVGQAVPSLADCSSSGYEAHFPFLEGDDTEHDVVAVFESSDGRIRHYPVRRFTWRPAP